MITEKMQKELSRIMRGEPQKESINVRGRLVSRGFAKKIGKDWVLTQDGKMLLNFIGRR